MKEQLSVVIVGAHPDDCEIFAGGLTLLYKQAGHRVAYITMTNGDAGHHIMGREELAARRYQETRRVSECLGVDYHVMDISDGRLDPSVENREKLIAVLRRYDPDIVITHPADDYHPDHRYTSQLVTDTAYMLSVPLCVPQVPALKKQVVYCHFCFEGQDDSSVVTLIPVDDVMDEKIRAVHQNTSQIYEWLPWIDGVSAENVPEDEAGRITFLRRRMEPLWALAGQRFSKNVNVNSDQLGVRYLEAFVGSAYGKPLTRENARQLFPFDRSVVL